MKRENFEKARKLFKNIEELEDKAERIDQKDYSDMKAVSLSFEIGSTDSIRIANLSLDARDKIITIVRREIGMQEQDNMKKLEDL